MIWAYDSAIVEDLRNSFSTEPGQDPVVSIVPPEDIVSIAAQAQEDKIRYPMIAITRDNNMPIDTERWNFTRAHKGIATVFDTKDNMIYYEKATPVQLQYTLVCISTNTADVDELIRELLFKYTSQYFLTVTIPYESKRKIRIGVRVNPDDDIEYYTTTSNYLEEGKLYSAGIKLHIDGAVLISYTPSKLRRFDTEVGVAPPSSEKLT